MKGFNHLEQLPKSDMHGRHIFEAVQEGLAPFKPRTINIFTEYVIDYHRYAIFVEVWFPDYRLGWREDLDAWDLADDIDGQVRNVSARFFEAFRNREDFPVHDKIVLGEN